MTGYFLKKVSIEGFRGINNSDNPLELRFDQTKVNSVFGHNGLGKSSIFDAITYAVRGTIARLDRMHNAEQAAAYYNNCFHPTKIAIIILTLMPDDGSADIDIRVQRTATGLRTVDSPTGYPTPIELLKSLDNPFLLLDQQTFLRFVEDTPLIRGRAFSSLLGLAELSEYRQVLRILSNAGNLKTDLQLVQTDTSIASAEASIRDLSTRIKATYDDFYLEEIAAGIDHVTSPSAVVINLSNVPLIHSHCFEKALGEIDFAKLNQSIAEAENSDQRVRLAQIIDAISALEAMPPSDAEPSEFIALRELVFKLEVAITLTLGPAYFKMLMAVEEVIGSPDWENPNECPACVTILNHPLLPEVQRGLATYADVDSIRADLLAHWSDSAWPSRLKKLEEYPSLEWPEEKHRHAAFKVILEGSPESQDITNVVEYLATLDTKRIEVLQLFLDERDDIKATLPPSLVTLTTKVQAAERLSKLLPSLESAQTGLVDLRKRKLRRDAWKAYIELAEFIFSNAETALSTEIAESLETRYQDSYKEITNNPDIVPILERSQGTEDLNLRLKRFHTLSNVPAASLLPESYRNALGISIYLSAASQRPVTARFMVLDDITSSFDAGHQFHLMELIRSNIAYPTNAAGPQVILLSHDGLLEKYFDKISGQGIWHHHKLQGIPPRGALLGHAQSADRLRLIAEEHLSLGQIETAEPIIRQYLEYVLLQIIRKVGVLVPIDFAIQDDRKMVGNAIEVIRQSVSMHKAAGTLILDAAQESDFLNVHAAAIVGNWVTHYESGVTSAFNAYSLKGILDTIDKLKTCFQYPCSCNGAPQPKFYRTLSAKHCHC